MKRGAIVSQNDEASPQQKDDPLLSASKAGWPTTLRYALLLLVKHGTVGAIMVTVADLVIRLLGHLGH